MTTRAEPVRDDGPMTTRAEPVRDDGPMTTRAEPVRDGGPMTTRAEPVRDGGPRSVGVLWSRVQYSSWKRSTRMGIGIRNEVPGTGTVRSNSVTWIRRESS